MTAPKVAMVPYEVEILRDAAQAAGGVMVAPPEADAVIWTDPSDAAGLRDVLDASPARWIQLPFAGIERFFAAGVVDPARTWTCAKGIYGPACAELALGLIASAARSIHRHAIERRWWSGDPSTHRRIEGSTALIVGTGGIGISLAGMLRPLGVRLLAVNRSGRPMEGAERTEPFTELASLVSEADWIVLAMAMTRETTHIIDAGILAKMKPDAWIVNVARGAAVDTDALLDALRAGAIGGAALDVTDPEPLPDDHPLWSTPNVIITSHTANTVWMALPDLARLVERNVRKFAAGEELEGLVDPALGY